MRGVFSGDTKRLQQLAQTVGTLRAPAARRRLLNAIGHGALERVLTGFEQSRDPYGMRWKDLKYRQGQPLRDRGLLMNSINVRVTSSSFELATDRKGARLHQHGGVVVPRRAKMLAFKVNGRTVFAKKVTIPARPFVPDGRGLPRSWATGFHEDAAAFFRQHLRMRRVSP